MIPDTNIPHRDVRYILVLGKLDKYSRLIGNI